MPASQEQQARSRQAALDCSFSYFYTAFGQQYGETSAETLPQRYTFTGREAAGPAARAAGAPMYYRYRMYSPGLGRFGRRDPKVDLVNQTNGYVGMANRPPTHKDPLGTDIVTLDAALLACECDGVVSHFDLTKFDLYYQPEASYTGINRKKVRLGRVEMMDLPYGPDSASIPVPVVGVEFSRLQGKYYLPVNAVLERANDEGWTDSWISPQAALASHAIALARAGIPMLMGGGEDLEGIRSVLDEDEADRYINLVKRTRASSSALPGGKPMGMPLSPPPARLVMRGFKLQDDMNFPIGLYKGQALSLAAGMAGQMVGKAVGGGVPGKGVGAVTTLFGHCLRGMMRATSAAQDSRVDWKTLEETVKKDLRFLKKQKTPAALELEKSGHGTCWEFIGSETLEDT